MSAIVGCLLRFWYYTSLAFGITAYNYDFKKRTFHSSLSLKCYSILLNALTLLLLPLYLGYGSAYLDIFEAKPLMSIINHSNVIVHSLIIIYTVILRHRKDRGFCGLVMELRALEAQYFVSLPNYFFCDDHGNEYNWLFYGKFLTLCLQNLYTVGIVMLVHKVRPPNLFDLIVNCYFCFVWNYLHSTIFCYFLSMLYICKRFDALNAQLRQLFNQVQLAKQQNLERRSDRLSLIEFDAEPLEDFRLLLRTHQQLQHLTLRINELFSFHITALLIMFFLTNLNTFYVAFAIASTILSSNATLLISSASFVIKYIDVLLITHCCDKVVTKQKEVSCILREWQPLLVANGETERVIKVFSTKFAITSNTISVYRMFNLNNRAAFTVFLTTTMHAIIVIQFDYMMKV